MKLLYWLAFIVLLPGLAAAQSNYKKAYILKNSGDTVKGYIDYREWQHSPREIKFKSTLATGTSTSFTPADLQEFGIYNLDTFISYKGSITMDPAAFADLSAKLDTSSKQDTIFMRQVFKGPNVSLYANRDNIRQRLFYREGHGQPVELLYHEYYPDFNRQEVKSTPIYRGQLIALLNKYRSNDERLLAKIQEAEYTINQIEPIIYSLNFDKKEQHSDPAKRLFVGAGIDLNSTKFSGTNDFTAAKASTTVGATLHTGLDFFINPNVQHLIFRGEFSLSSLSSSFTVPTYLAGENTYEHYTMKAYLLSLVPQLILNVYNNDKFKFYLGTGIGFNFANYTTNRQHTDFTRVDITSDYNLKPLWFNVPVETGIVLNKRIEIFARYFFPVNISDNYAEFSINTSITSVGVHYLFNSK